MIFGNRGEIEITAIRGGGGDNRVRIFLSVLRN